MNLVLQIAAFGAAFLLLTIGPTSFQKLARLGLFAAGSILSFMAIYRLVEFEANATGLVILTLSLLGGLVLSSIARFPLAARWGGVAIAWLTTLAIHQYLTDITSATIANTIACTLGALSVLSGFATIGSFAGLLLILALRLPQEMTWTSGLILGACYLIAWLRFGRLPAQSVSVASACHIPGLHTATPGPVSMALTFDTTLDRKLFLKSAQRHGHIVTEFTHLDDVLIIALPRWRAILLQRLNRLTGLFHAGWPTLAECANAPCTRPNLPNMNATSSDSISLEEIRTRLRTGENGKLLPERKFNGAGASVAILDTGVEDRPEYAGKIASRESFVPGESVQDICDCRHGSNCGMIVNAVAPDAELHFFKILGGTHGMGQLDWILQAYNRVLEKGIPIINGSFGSCRCKGASTCLSCRAVESLQQKGVIVCAAAGNSGPSPGSIDCPGGSRGAIAVAAATRDLRIASFSSRGPSADGGNAKPDITAYGSNVLLRSRPHGSNSETMSGTSFSCPQIAGVAAIALQLIGKPTESENPEQKVRDVLLRSACPKDLSPTHRHPDAAGRGLINVSRLVAVYNKGALRPVLETWVSWRWLLRPASAGIAASLAIAILWSFADHVHDLVSGNQAKEVTLLGKILTQPGGLAIEDGTNAMPLIWTASSTAPSEGSIIILSGSYDPQKQSIIGSKRIVLMGAKSYSLNSTTNGKDN